MVGIVTLATVAALMAQEPSFRTTVPVVLVPVAVTDKVGRYVDGLEAADFEVLEDGHVMSIQMDASGTAANPLAVVIAIQANATGAAALKKVAKTGSMIEPLITGERGHAAVLAFGSEVTTMQDFTSDANELTQTFRKLHAKSGNAARMLDAVDEAVRLLAAREGTERRVVVVISESRDRGSKVKLEEVIKSAQVAGVTIFPVVFSAYMTPFTTKASDLPQSTGGVDLIAAIGELARLGKADSSRLLAEYSGGRRASFATLHGLENVVTDVGEELHAGYLLSYSNRGCVPGFHRLEVRVKSRPEAVIRARYGYWGTSESCGAAVPR